MMVLQKKEDRRYMLVSLSVSVSRWQTCVLQHLAWGQSEEEICPLLLWYSAPSSSPSWQRHKHSELSPSSHPCGSLLSSSSPPFSPPLLCLPLSQWKCSAGPRAPASNCWWMECFHGVLGRALPWISMLTYTRTHAHTTCTQIHKWISVFTHGERRLIWADSSSPLEKARASLVDFQAHT